MFIIYLTKMTIMMREYIPSKYLDIMVRTYERGREKGRMMMRNSVLDIKEKERNIIKNRKLKRNIRDAMSKRSITLYPFVINLRNL